MDFLNGPTRDALKAMGMPDEMIDTVLKQQDMGEADQERRVANTERLINSLPQEELETLQGLIRASTADPGYGQYVNGWISTVLNIKYKICRYCNRVHESVEDLLEKKEHDQ